MTALEEARERALHLLDDNSIQARRKNGTFPERWTDGREYRFNWREDMRKVRDGWRALSELWNARMLPLELRDAIHRIDSLHDRAIAAFPGVSKDDPAYQSLQAKTRWLIGKLMQAMTDLQRVVDIIDESMWVAVSDKADN